MQGFNLRIDLRIDLCDADGDGDVESHDGDGDGIATLLTELDI